MRIIILDGAEMTDRDVLHGYLKRELRFDRGSLSVL